MIRSGNHRDPQVRYSFVELIKQRWGRKLVAVAADQPDGSGEGFDRQLLQKRCGRRNQDQPLNLWVVERGGYRRKRTERVARRYQRSAVAPDQFAEGGGVVGLRVRELAARPAAALSDASPVKAEHASPGGQETLGQRAEHGIVEIAAVQRVWRCGDRRTLSAGVPTPLQCPGLIGNGDLERFVHHSDLGYACQVPRESKKARIERAGRIAKALFAAYPDAHCALKHADAYQLLVATILSAQCTDKRVNLVTPDLFAKYPSAKAMASADLAEVEELIRSTGFYRNKAKSLVGMASAVLRDHGGEIPRTLEQLVRLPGVGRKTANVILGNVFSVPGMVVDTHVGRISRHLKLTRETDAVKVERDLMELVEPEDWTQLAHAMIFHGRSVCTARRRDCGQCPISDDCPAAD